MRAFLRQLLVSWPLLVPGLVLVLYFLPERLAFLGRLDRATGTVVGSGEVGSSKALRKRWVDHEMVVAGRTYRGRSFGDHGLPLHAVVDVEYVPGDPARARIVGMHDDGGLTWLGALVGATLCVVGVWGAIDRIRHPPPPPEPLPSSPGPRSDRKRKKRR